LGKEYLDDSAGFQKFGFHLAKSSKNIFSGFFYSEPFLLNSCQFYGFVGALKK